MMEHYIRWLIRRRGLILLTALLLTILATAGIGRLLFTTDYRVFFSADNPQLTAFEALQKTYTQNDNILFTIAPRDGRVFTRETLAAIRTLTEAAWQIPYAIRVDSLTNFQHSEARGDELHVHDLVPDPGVLDDAALERIQRIALDEPLLVRRLVSERAHVAGVNVTLQLPGRTLHEEVPEAAAQARALAARLMAFHPQIEVQLTGIVMMNNAFSEASQHDAQTLVPLMFGAIVVTLILLLRSVYATLATVLVILMSTGAAMGLAGWLGIQLTPPSVNAPTIALTLAVADCVHILMTWLQGLRVGLDRREAMAASMRSNFHPVFLTSFTTAVGFLGMNFSEVPPFRDLGNIVTIGVALAWLLSVSFLPALLLYLPVRVPQGRTQGQHSMERFADFVIRRRGPLLWGTLAITLLLGLSITRNELNDQFVEYFDETVDYRRATDFVTANLTGVYLIDYSLRTGDPGGISEPAYLQRLEDFTLWLRTQPEVLHVNALTDIMKRLNRNLHGDDPAWHRLPDARELAAQYLLLYEMSLPYGLDLNNQINVDRSATRITVALQSLTSKQMLGFESRVSQWLAAHAPDLHAEAGSPALMFAHIGMRNIVSLITGNLLALVVISLSLVIVFRSLRIGITSMIPNLVPVAMAFGLWGLLNGRVGLGLSVVTSMTMGIVVDDTIHFLSKYLHARRTQGADSAAAVRYAFGSVGLSLWVLSLVLIVGFLVLALSHFKLNAEMGLLTATTFALGLVVEFLFLAPLLLRLERPTGRA